MKKPYPLIPTGTMTVEYGTKTEVFSDEMLKIMFHVEKYDISGFKSYFAYFTVSFVGDYTPTDSTRLYAISDSSNTKYTLDFLEDDGVYYSKCCEANFNGGSAPNGVSDKYTYKWVVENTIYSLSLGLQHNITAFDDETVTFVYHGSGHINGVSTVGENPFEEGV